MSYSQSQERILVFPGGMPRSLEFLGRCKQEGRTVVGASSLRYDPESAAYDQWAYLPYVVSPTFSDELAKLVAEKGVTAIYTPNLVVWDFLAHNIAAICPGVRLLNESPSVSELSPYRAAISRARRSAEFPIEVGSWNQSRERLGLNEVAGMYRLIDTIPGMCDYDKIHALVEMLRHVPSGDLVEIGSWWGKSAALLSILARRYAIGQLACVDPWTDGNLLQSDASSLVDATARQISASDALEVFEMNLAPLAHGTMNYFRSTSVDAAKVFAQTKTATTKAFGTTRYAGKISVLHIDGNHDYSAVVADIQAWSPYLTAGAVVIFDDYVWPFGDGPKRAADEFIQSRLGDIEVAFAMGSAMFVKLNAKAH